MNSQNSGPVKTRTPGDWRIIEFPGREDQFFIAAVPYEGHPYFGVTAAIEVMSDEDYPTKRADAEFIVRAVNSHDALVAALKWAMVQVRVPARRISRQNEKYCDDHAKARAAIALAEGRDNG